MKENDRGNVVGTEGEPLPAPKPKPPDRRLRDSYVTSESSKKKMPRKGGTVAERGVIKDNNGD